MSSNPGFFHGTFVLSLLVVTFRRKSQQAEREYEKVKHQLDNLEESVRERCKKEFTGNCRVSVIMLDFQRVCLLIEVKIRKSAIIITQQNLSLSVTQ